MTIEKMVVQAELLRQETKAPNVFATGFIYGYIQAYKDLVDQFREELKTLSISTTNLNSKE